MPPRVFLVRHGQGFHQLEPTEKNQYLPDPALTEEGIARCKHFAENFPKSAHLDLICASPLQRTIQTAKYTFAERLEKIAPIILLPYAQEATDLPSDTGSDRPVIEERFGKLVDASLVEEGWNSNTGIYAPTPEALKDRAAKLRAWLHTRPEGEVAVVGHGNFWHYLTGEVDENGKQTSKLSLWEWGLDFLLTRVIAPYWSNNEWRSYTFVEGKDGSVDLQEDEESIARREALS
jgi:broad specificity phosphatase PhoE